MAFNIPEYRLHEDTAGRMNADVHRRSVAQGMRVTFSKYQRDSSTMKEENL